MNVYLTVFYPFVPSLCIYSICVPAVFLIFIRILPFCAFIIQFVYFLFYFYKYSLNFLYLKRLLKILLNEATHYGAFIYL